MVSFSFGGTSRYNKEIEHRNIPIRPHRLVDDTVVDPGWQTKKYAYLAEGGWYIGGGGIVPRRASTPSQPAADAPAAPAPSRAVHEPGGPDSITGSSGP